MKSKKEFSILTIPFLMIGKGCYFTTTALYITKKIPFENSKGIFLYKIN